MLIATPGSGTGLQSRTATNGITSFTQANLAVAPYWLRLQRAGTNVAGYGSIDGINWTNLGAIALPMSKTILAGLAVTAHNDSLLSTATFSSVFLTHPPPPLPAQLTIAWLTNRLPLVTIAGSTGATYVCQTSTNLVNWTSVETNVNVSGSIRIQPAVTNLPYRGFFRAVLLP